MVRAGRFACVQDTRRSGPRKKLELLTSQPKTQTQGNSTALWLPGRGASAQGVSVKCGPDTGVAGNDRSSPANLFTNRATGVGEGEFSGPDRLAWVGNVAKATTSSGSARFGASPQFAGFSRISSSMVRPESAAIWWVAFSWFGEYTEIR